MLAFTFRGGIHIDEHKHTRGKRIETLPPPKTVSIPLLQHIGATCQPTVAVGDTVAVGQRIGDSGGGLFCPVHSSVSGKVIAIEEKFGPMGNKIISIVIENDFQDTLADTVKPFEKPLQDATPEEIIGVIRDAGISGMGGATFPTYAKIESAIGRVDRIIINCAECEPFICADHRIMLENPAAVINGVKILLKALGVRQADLAVEDNKLDAVNKLEALVADSQMISVKVMKTKYPQGDERQLIYALTGKELPAGKLPADVGCVIFNVETCASIFNAFAHGMPLIRRVVTVDGDCIKTPKNIMAPIGTPYRDLIDFCGGLIKTPEKLISGGPMMGRSVWTPDMPVMKGTSAILVLSKKFTPRTGLPPVCIRCGRCVSHCPMRLMPNYIAQFSRAGDYARAEEFGAMSCVECGVCSAGCPGHLELTQQIRVAKNEIKKAAKLKK
ncbi:MAG: electron transport complex subunit RsxC [Ruminococcaceae bacterium]|nr:electron transport complex subunit RsxC [Oscillospiraceae bacterium]